MVTGAETLQRHSSSDGHTRKMEDWSSQKIKGFFLSASPVNSMTTLESKARRAEVTTTMVEGNVFLRLLITSVP